MNRQQQIIQAHAGVIVQVVQSIQNPALMPATEEILKVSEQNGWNDLVGVIRRMIKGEREASLLKGLDEEDATIAAAILEGLQNPASLPDPNQKPDASMAAPGLAHMIQQAANGDTQALQLIANMAEQMARVNGDMAQLSGMVRKMINGERDEKVLTKGMGPQGKQLMLSILEELQKLQSH